MARETGAGLVRNVGIGLNDGVGDMRGGGAVTDSVGCGIGEIVGTVNHGSANQINL